MLFKIQFLLSIWIDSIAVVRLLSQDGITTLFYTVHMMLNVNLMAFVIRLSVIFSCRSQLLAP